MVELLNQLAIDRGLGDDLLPTRGAEREPRRFLVARHVSLEIPRAWLRRAVLHDPPARSVGRERHHVLAGGVTRRVLEDEEDFLPDDRGLEVDEAAKPRRLCDDFLELAEAWQDPREEQSDLRNAVEEEAGRSRDFLGETENRNAAALAGEIRAAIVRRDCTTRSARLRSWRAARRSRRARRRR